MITAYRSMLCVALAGYAVLTACADHDPLDTPVLPAPSTQQAVPATAGADDPSVPAATQVFGGDVTPAVKAQDSAATNPKASLTAREEAESLPKAGQVNNHSSVALDAAPANR